jgi:DNA repair protein RecO (recombination protein O)
VTLYRDQGVVLRTIKLGEADRIITVMTQGHGKVRAVAKGVRKTKSRFGARLEPISHVALQLYEGRELDVITQADGIEHSKAIREDLDRLAKATSLLEAVDQVAQERQANPRLYQLLVGGLRSLGANNAPLLVPAFFWKLLSLDGVHPLLDECARCGVADGLVAFNLSEGGTLCRNCRSGIPVSPEALALLRRILGGELAASLRQAASPVTREVDHLATVALESHLERRLRTVTVLDQG